MVRKLAIIILVLGLVGIVLGGVFLYQGFTKNNQLKEAMRAEQIVLGIDTGDIEEGELIDTGKEAQVAGDTVREHRHGIAPTYGELLGGEKFNATNPTQLTYAQALNLENYLYLAVLGFGFTQAVLAIGVFMIVVGLALGGTGVSLFRLTKAY
ncbi:MAG: hypothetical protein P8105_03000 [Dehalococcoidia bacterium]